MALKDTIRTARKGAGLTQAELAAKTGVSQQAIQKYETGIITNIASDKIELIAKACGCSPAYLMGWEEVKKNNDALSDIIIRAQKDEDFFAALVSLHNLPADKLAAVKVVIDTLGQ